MEKPDLELGSIASFARIESCHAVFNGFSGAEITIPCEQVARAFIRAGKQELPTARNALDAALTDMNLQKQAASAFRTSRQETPAQEIPRLRLAS